MIADRIVRRRVSELKPSPQNARKHSRKQIRQIANSVERFGFTNPVLIDEAGRILAGHGRVQAAQLLGMDEVPCILIENLSEAEKRAYILADNKLAQNAGWDEEILAIELQYLIESVDEIDVSITGFDDGEIDALIDVGGNNGDVGAADDQLPELPGGPPTSEAGDLWICGDDHRLLCGDALNPTSFQVLLQDSAGRPELAQMVFTDPPYNVRIDGHVGGSGKIKHREFAMASGEMSRSTFTAFLSDIAANLVRFSVDGSIHYICMDWRHLIELQTAGELHYSELKNVIAWDKGTGAMGTFYRSRHELVFVWKSGTAPHINTFELGQNGRYRTNVWTYRGISAGGKTAREELRMHPTVKPVGMVADAMKDCSGRGGIVLDPFCGSGTILIAAQKTGRRARAIEIDPVYCDTAIIRWQHFAKDDAVLASTGETFSAVQKRRRSELQSAAASRPAEQDIPAAKPVRSPSPWALRIPG